MTATSAPAVLPAAEAYRLWAPSYDAESAFSAIEDQGVRAHSPLPERGTRLLDAACGTARRLAGAVARGARGMGIDLVPEMLLEGRQRHGGLPVAAAALDALPFPSAAFDLVWCRLALGHLERIEPAYRELARVAVAGGTVVVTDFHPSAADAGFARAFTDSAGMVHAVRHFRHGVEDHRVAAAAAGLVLSAAVDLTVGPAAQPFYEAAGRGRQYLEQHGRPMVLLLRFERSA
ncbi:MAG TPA: class I SAM-dependent methyltransferase [Longimicrobium sp.]|nr:class I SAM-dependent methyltransferase [Longimicrobium sp.]